MKNNRKWILCIWLLYMVISASATSSVRMQVGDIDQRYRIAVCDWMILKRQKIGAFQLAKELGSDGLELDMGSLGKRDSFDNKLRLKRKPENLIFKYLLLLCQDFTGSLFFYAPIIKHWCKTV